MQTIVDHLRGRPVPRRAAEAEAADALVVVAAALRHRIVSSLRRTCRQKL